MEVTEETILKQIKRAKEGKQNAFNFLLDHFWNLVYGFQLKRVNNEHDAEDITIEAFSKAFDKIEIRLEVPHHLANADIRRVTGQPEASVASLHRL